MTIHHMIEKHNITTLMMVIRWFIYYHSNLGVSESICFSLRLNVNSEQKIKFENYESRWGIYFTLIRSNNNCYLYSFEDTLSTYCVYWLTIITRYLSLLIGATSYKTYFDSKNARAFSALGRVVICCFLV